MSFWHATTKTWGCSAFSDFFCKKRDHTQVRSHFENSMKTSFFQTPFIFNKTLHKKYRIVIVQDLIEKLLLKKNVDLGISAITKKPALSHSFVSWLGHFLRSKI